jgi:hypothetical protein
MKEGASKREVPFMSNGRIYNLRTEQATDEQAGADLARARWIFAPKILYGSKGQSRETIQGTKPRSGSGLIALLRIRCRSGLNFDHDLI